MLQSSTLRENLIVVNNLSGIVCWSYLFIIIIIIFLMMFFYQPLAQREPNGFTGRLVCPKSVVLVQHQQRTTHLGA